MSEAERPKTAQDRLREKKRQESETAGSITFLQQMRGYLDVLVFAYVLAMFIRSFVFELFMIPTGSMTPTLIGDSVGEVVHFDYDDDGVKDVVYTSRRSPSYLQIFLMNEEGTYKDLIFLEGVDPSITRQLASQSRQRKDMIVVNKFAYWFSTPERGDIAVFKVPDVPDSGHRLGQSVFEPTKPVYIKRVVGLPGETITIQATDRVLRGINDPGRYSNRWGGNEVHLAPNPVLVNGEPLTEPRFDTLIHFSMPRSLIPGPADGDNVMEVPDDAALLIGDNAASSKDSRYWGPVPLDHLRGKAVLRYFPLGAASFLE